MKNLLTLFLLTVFILSAVTTTSTMAQEKDNTFSGSKMLESINSGANTVREAAEEISDQIGASTQEVEKIINNVRDEIEAGGKLIEGLVKEAIPPEVAEELSKLGDLGDLLNVESFADLVKIPEIREQIEAFALENLPDEASDFIASVLEIAGDADSLNQAAKEAVVNAIIEELPPEIIDLFGGEDSVFSSLMGSIENNSVNNPVGEAASGEYEIFDRDPKSAAVSSGIDASCRHCTCKTPIQQNHRIIRARVTDEFIKQRTWMIDEIFSKHILPAMTLMSLQLTTIAVQQTQMIGAFFDAKHQMETQRIFQLLMAEAHKDYQPSEGLCEVGTNVRSLAASEKKTSVGKAIINNHLMDRQLSTAETLSSADNDSDLYGRIVNFIYKYCNEEDNTGGLDYLCKNGGQRPEKFNKDINFTKTIESNLTLDINPENSLNTEENKEDILALSANLFAHETLPNFASDLLATEKGQPRSVANRYMDLRAIAAKRSVAINSFSSLIAERASGDSEVAPYLKKLVTELGVPAEDVEEILGQNPSYFAQMEVLTKDAYQNPVFYTELYDKPANVLRKSATLRAIRLMQERDLYESQLRSEAVLAVMLEAMLTSEQDRVEADFISLQMGDE